MMKYVPYFILFIIIILIIVIVIIIKRSISRIVDQRIDNFQSSLISKHYSEVQNIYNNMRGWRHDYHNHLQAIKAHLSLNQIDELYTYLDKLENDLKSVDNIFKTGNLMLDAILNSKISLANSMKISVIAKAEAPEKLFVSEIDLCVIIGNLIDNATEACKKLENTEDRFIRVYIGVIKKQLYISVTNSVGGEVKKVNKEYFTTKDKNHGFGIKRINAIVNKYAGYINRQNEPGVFATEIMLPL
jgi:two-component system sensor histidine kinase AgrC